MKCVTFADTGRMSDRRRLVYSIIQFVQEEIKSEELSDDAKESLEVTKINVTKYKYKYKYK